MLLAYVAGILISSLPLLPGGFGAVEAAIPAMLHHFGAALDAALAGTLVYRANSALLPAAAGALLLQRGVVASGSTPPRTQCGEGEPLALSRSTRTVVPTRPAGSRAARSLTSSA